MSLVSLSNFCIKEIYQRKNSQLTSVFDRLELYKYTATYNGDEGLAFLLGRLHKDIPCFFMLYLKLYVMIKKMANNASFE